MEIFNYYDYSILDNRSYRGDRINNLVLKSGKEKKLTTDSLDFNSEKTKDASVLLRASFILKENLL